MPLLDFKRLKELIPLKAVLKHLLWEPSYVEREELRGHCPLHAPQPHQSRSFAVKGDGWYCHQCKEGGDQLNLYGTLRGLSDYEAALELCKLLGVPVPWKPRKERHARAPRNREEEQ